ncbi:MAG: heme-binding protein, partial [Candidatus Methylumidiphilus sp.]
QWLSSRAISAQKANTALGLSTTSFALSTANLYSPVQPNGSLYGLQAANPTDTSAGYSGNSANFGMPLDPMRGRKIGGTNVFGGGLALYNGGKLVGGLGVSGDTSCADHNVAWRLREKLTGFTSTNVPNGFGTPKDNIIYLAAPDQAAPYAPTEQPNGFKHPWCSNTAKQISETF